MSNNETKSEVDMAWNKYKDRIENFSNGFLILLDIIDSTTRKQEYKHCWIEQTQYIEAMFKSLVKNIKAEICKKYSEIEINSCFKSLGDGFMAFIQSPKSKKEDPESDYVKEVAEIVLECFFNMDSNYREDKSYELKNLYYKTVITYLTDIYYKETKNSKDDHIIEDVLGRGIDFSFRLEKFGGASHYVINTMFFNAIKSYCDKKKLTGIPIFKYVKGWKDPQDFYVLTNEHLINGSMTTIKPSINSNDVLTELLQFIFESQESKQEINIIYDEGIKKEDDKEEPNGKN